ncbi:MULTISPECIES: hypothetical protein [Enterobacter]|uniref:hypothetical protein n=1 Tax=Enterobacter TaxID=547 RepID=UPI0028EB7AAC|nr:hypothetical protein [Enterobacter cloacae]HDR2789149.1 hypothetical protein [Enterobacter asburiae]WNT37345.1 hypothetical protein RRL13_04315 [Enterobacter cloacae]HDR2791400.1 hypothetical protein [Enterobacter asburiae]HDR2796172.1 hypothetical protein [Enterobacter asburiae]HDR2801574.1 hypothetical protein [Enterobacter asburiae]
MEQQRQKGINFRPFVGSKYTNSRYGIRGLVLGESHYADEGEAGKDFTQHVVTTHAYRAGAPFFSKLTAVLRGDTSYPTDSERVETWQQVAFYNYVQEIVGDGSRIAPTREAWDAAQAPFFEVVRELKPNVILVLGSRLWEEVPNLPPEYPVVWCSITHPSGGMAYTSSITALAESIVKAGGIFIKDKEQL